MSEGVEQYIDADGTNLKSVRTKLPHFMLLVPGLHILYERSATLLPTDQVMFGRALLLCHKALLFAAVTIARLHPDDAAPATRRAVEVARVCLAIKADPENLERWKNTEQRLARWAARHAGEKPRRLSGEVRYPKDHPIVDALGRVLGSLSDMFVHFTPEYVHGRTWRESSRTEDFVTVELPFHETDIAKAEDALLLLGNIHLYILSALDECLDGRLSADEEWERRRAVVHLNASQLAGERQ